MKILVTGHRGFVGGYFWDKFKKEGHQLTGVDIKEGEDARDFFRYSYGSYQFDLVIHCAAVVGGRLGIEGDPIGVATDLSIDSEMFNWAARAQPKQVVYFSSSAAYPVIDQEHKHQLFEDSIDFHSKNKVIGIPDETYGWAKLTGEMLSEHLRKKGVPVLVVRPFSGYGTGQDLTYPVASYIDRAKQKVDPFIIWGNGEQVRDFVHISDIYNLVMKLLTADKKKWNPNLPYNLGTGVATSFNRLASLVCEEAGYKPQFLHDLSKPVGVQYRVASTLSVGSLYTPRVSLREGIRNMLND